MSKKSKGRIARKMDNEEIWNWYNFNLDKGSRTLYFGPWNDAETGLGTEDCAQPWEVSDWSAQNIIKGLHVLEQESEEPILINWFSYGGDWDAGTAIYDYIKGCKSYITMKCYGRVRSMGTVILQAADKRLLSPNCMFLIHYGEAGYEATEQDFVRYTEQLVRDRTVMENIYLEKIRANKPRYSRERIQDMMQHDKYMTPTEAVEIGLADEIIK